MSEKKPWWRMWGRIAFALVGALAVAYAATFCFFNADIDTEMRKVATTLDAWKGDAQRLRDEKEKIKPDAELQIPTVGRDPDVIRLRGQLEQKKAEFEEADRQAIGEHDGTSGTGVPGAGSDYYLKVERRDRLGRERDDLAAQLKSKEDEIARQVDQLTQKRERATTRLAEIEEWMRRPAPPRPSVRAAMFAVDNQKHRAVTEVLFGVFAAFFVVDFLALFLVVRYICRDGNRGTRKAGRLGDLVRRQAEEDERTSRAQAEEGERILRVQAEQRERAREAMSPQDLSAGMQAGYFSEGRE